MERSLSISENRSFDKIRNIRWYLPLLYFATIAMCITGVFLSMTRNVFPLPGDRMMFVGADVLGMGICVVLFKGCLTGKNSNGDMTFLFASLTFANDVLLFFDLCSGVLQGLADMRLLNTIVNIGTFAFIPLLIYFFWRYVRVVAELDSHLPRWIILLMQILFIPMTAISLLNLFFSFSFSISSNGFTDYEFGSAVTFGYAFIAAAAIISGLRHSKMSVSHKRIIKMFFGVPIVCSFFAMPLFGSTLFSIVLLYVIVYTEKSNILAATQTELNTAANIQLSSLPRRFPKKKEFSLYASMEPAKEVGGDFYDFFFVDKDRLALVAADVSGKGAPAALFMMRAKTIIKSLARSGMSPAKVLSDANSSIMESNEEDMFVTVWLGILEIQTGRLTYADAGHEKLLIFNKGEWKFLPKEYTGFALGTIDSDEIEEMPPENQYVDVQIKLDPGDVIIQYTDGVTEAIDPKKQFFGETGLLEAVKSSKENGPRELLHHIRSQIDGFVGEEPQFDDITMIGLRYNGTEQKSEEQ